MRHQWRTGETVVGLRLLVSNSLVCRLVFRLLQEVLIVSCGLTRVSVPCVLSLCMMFPCLADLQPGDVVPDCSKIPLVPISQGYRPGSDLPRSLEHLLRKDGVVIVHFLSPRPERGAPFETYFAAQLSALAKATHSVAYPCTAVPVVPLGEKGRMDALRALQDRELDVWMQLPVYYEPTFPRPGLYRTFRPQAAGEQESITTSWTYLIGPERTILAVRAPSQDGQLYDWLQGNLPENVVEAALAPTTRVSVPDPGDWDWPMFRRTVRHAADAEQLEDRLPYTYVAWQSRVGGSFSSPAVHDGRVYVCTDSRGLHVLQLSDGMRLGRWSGGASWWTSPVVAGNLVYHISSEGVVTALDRRSLARRWQQRIGGLVTSSPVVSGGALYVGARNGAVFALDADNGDILWRAQTGGEISSSPALGDGLLVIGSGDRKVYALEADTGKPKWSAATGGAADSSPLVVGDEVLVGSFDGALYCLSLADGGLRWRCPLSGWVHSSPAADPDTVFVGTVNIARGEVPAFHWIDRATGKLKGSFEMPGPVYSSPTIWHDLVLVGCRDGKLYAFDRTMAQTQPLWTFETRSYVHATPVVVGDTVLVNSFDGNLYALRQSKPISVWAGSDVVPRWFMAALARQMHAGIGELILQAGGAAPGPELRLPVFDDLFKQIRGEVMASPAGPKVLPRDVPSGHPGAPYIEYVLTGGLLGGFPDGTFRPSQPTNRYQFSSALSSVLDWASRRDYVWRVLKDGNISGVQVEVRVAPEATTRPAQVVDVPSGHWAKQALQQQAANMMLPVDEGGRFRGDRLVTLDDAKQQWDLIAKGVRIVRTQ